jgi:hypothetical protein
MEGAEKACPGLANNGLVLIPGANRNHYAFYLLYLWPLQPFIRGASCSFRKGNKYQLWRGAKKSHKYVEDCKNDTICKNLQVKCFKIL